MSVPVAVFASGGGTNLQALLHHEASSPLWRVALVVSDRPGAGALERARTAGRPTVVIPVKGRDPGDVAGDTLHALADHGIDLVLLAGYLRLVPSGVVEAYPERILNIHPALLPAFGGAGMYGRRVHEAVLAARARVTGVTVHRVDPEYDSGTILAQWPVPVRADDTPESLAARVLTVEHVLYPLTADHVVRAIAEGRAPAPFDIPGDAFTLAQEDPDIELPRQIRGAFRRR